MCSYVFVCVHRCVCTCVWCMCESIDATQKSEGADFILHAFHLEISVLSEPPAARWIAEPCQFNKKNIVQHQNERTMPPLLPIPRFRFTDFAGQRERPVRRVHDGIGRDHADVALHNFSALWTFDSIGLFSVVPKVILFKPPAFERHTVCAKIAVPDFKITVSSKSSGTKHKMKMTKKRSVRSLTKTTKVWVEKTTLVMLQHSGVLPVSQS